MSFGRTQELVIQNNWQLYYIGKFPSNILVIILVHNCVYTYSVIVCGYCFILFDKFSRNIYIHLNLSGTRNIVKQ